MDFPIDTDNKKLTLLFEVETRQPESIRTIVFDPEKPNTVYANGRVKINGKDVFYVRMPQSPKKAMVRIYNERIGVNGNSGKGTFKFNSKILPLKTKLTAFNYLNPDIINFVAFAQEFCENAGVYSAGNLSVRLSDNAKFRIHYVDYIKNPDGSTVNTPARISKISKRIETSKVFFLKETVPARMAMMLHEFSHGYLNYNMENEMEADYNALKIYLGLGYPRKEAWHVFTEIFNNRGTKQNRERWAKIKQFLNEFENQKNINYNYYYVGENGEKSA
ncbi:MAG: hypothetical protein Q8L90_06925 [Bacteroidota bacterium]|nr:hypothetical protein [Bacteroidota bacterium]